MTSSSSRNHSATGRASALLIAGFLTLTGAVLGAGASAAPEAQAEPWIVSPRRAAVPNPIPATAGNIAKGKLLYELECATCHGDTGLNDGPGAKKIAKEMEAARLLTDPEVQKQSDGALFWKMTEGRNEMPSSKKELSEEERWMVIHFLRTLVPAGSR